MTAGLFGPDNPQADLSETPLVHTRGFQGRIADLDELIAKARTWQECLALRLERRQLIQDYYGWLERQGQFTITPEE